jgi:hypothetical protein
MRGLEARLQRLEQETELEALKAIFSCMTVSELGRGSIALMSGDDARIKEGWSLLERGRARLEQGFTQADKDALNIC